MQENDFISSISTIRVWEKYLLDKSKLERMIEAQNFDDTLRILSEGNYDISTIKNPNDIEVLLKEELKNLYKKMYDICPHRIVVDLMALKYEYHNMKLIVKSKLTGSDLNYYINVFREGICIVKDKILNGDLKELSGYYKVAYEDVLANYENEKDLTLVDILLDHHMFKHMMIIANETKDQFAIDFVKLQLDFYNLKTFFRTKKLKLSPSILVNTLFEGGYLDIDKLIKSFDDSNDGIITKFSKSKYSNLIKEAIEDYISTNKLTKLEKCTDNYILSALRESKFTNKGLSPLITYIVSKETELKNVRIVLSGKLNDVSNNIILERLREVYA